MRTGLWRSGRPGRISMAESMALPPRTVQRNIEVVQQRLAVGIDRHDPAAFTSPADLLRTVEGLGKMQAQLVYPIFQGNVVMEVALAAAAINAGILGTPDVLYRASHRLPAGEIDVRIPRLPRAVHSSAG
jgi:hypothetical protein